MRARRGRFGGIVVVPALRASRSLVALLVVLVLVVAACGNSGDDDEAADTATTAAADDGGSSGSAEGDCPPVDQPGVTDDEIRVGGVASVTNPLGGKYAAAFDGVKAYFDMVNADGGVHCRQLVLVSERDDQLAKNQQEAQALVSQDDVFAALPLASLLFTGAQVYTEAGMPGFGWNIQPEWTGRENLFGHLGALCFGCVSPTLPWLATELGAEKVAILGYGVSEQSKTCATGLRDSFEKYGVEVAFFDNELPFGVPDLSAQVAEMKDAGVEFVTTCMDQNGVFTLAQEMRKQGLEAPQYMPNIYDQEFVAQNKDFFEGSYLAPQFLPFETEPAPEALQDFTEWIEKGDYEKVELSMIGWIAARTFHEGLELAGPDFTQQKVIDGLNTLTEWTADGLIAPIDWTTQHQDPKTGTRPAEGCTPMLKIEDGQFVPAFAPEGEPWLCWPTEPDELVDPTFKSFS